MPPRRVEGGTLVFDVDDVSVQLPGEIKHLCVDARWIFGVLYSREYYFQGASASTVYCTPVSNNAAALYYEHCLHEGTVQKFALLNRFPAVLVACCSRSTSALVT